MQANAATSPEPGKSAHVGFFGRWLHRAYFRSHGIHHLVLRRLRPAGISLWLIFVLTACLGMGQERRPIYQLFSFSFAMMLMGLPLAMFRRVRLEAVRDVPRHATAGEKTRYPVRVRSSGRRRLRRAWLVETAPDPRPDLHEFSTLREPGEEERNGFDRLFAYFRWQWLLNRRRMFFEVPSQDELDLAPADSQRVFMEIIPQRRGVIRLEDMRVLLPDPFGLFQNCVKVKAPPATILVLPKRYALPHIELPGSAAFKLCGETTSNAIGNTGEFVGLRDYRPGDPLRQIHWKSWARAGRPIVKELEDTFYPRHGLVVDTFCMERSDARFEEVISVAASFACSLDTSESLLDLMFIKDEAHVVTAGRGLERAEKLLEVLAGVTPERTEDFKPLLQLVTRHRDDLTSCLVILNGWDEARAEFLRGLEESGILCAPIIIGDGERPPAAPGHWLVSGFIARDLKRLPPRL